MGRGTGFIKIELKDVYWIVPVHPHDMYLLAITWQNVTYLDRALPFGLRSAPKIFSAVAYMIAWALHCCGLPQQINYLHDLLLFVHPSDQNGAEMLVNALQILDVLGVPVATVTTHKVKGPSTSLTFLGIVLDTMSFQLIPADELRCVKGMMAMWLSRNSGTRKELERFLGHLVHAATLIQLGRTFLRELFKLLHKVNKPQHFIQLTTTETADLYWWDCFLQRWNGHSFFLVPVPTVHVYSDASTTFGCGAFAQGRGGSPYPGFMAQTFLGLLHWSHMNVAADALSRNDLLSFFSLFPLTPWSPIPSATLDLLVRSLPI
ncbi:PREDICTED: uncharacterized protein LOC105313901 [Amphimedon queenslandica]|uniref:Reverse transcriptase domain-containing protein n=1 Tax=Amphimedon queenslandica TaxID=400682 RepID=A0AAN0IPE4_AMPQE|nr:PREDICTED: uncharacterized protein LOC105313901 [Amphimedon queenslandica]|eukprot:XP_011405990.1 PREDICTED: uncharacterized protein LOC105313901 [Amphimedon queenslandica]